MPRSTLPAIPKEVETVHGPVAVVFTTDEVILGEGVFGAWDNHGRIIYIRQGMHRTAEWLTLFHEKAHADLDDIADAFSHEMLEVLCNTIAAARLRELQAEVAKRPKRKRTGRSS